MGTVLLKCFCTHMFQDREHGVGWRIHNTTNKKRLGCTCTVCGDVKRGQQTKWTPDFVHQQDWAN